MEEKERTATVDKSGRAQVVNYTELIIEMIYNASDKQKERLYYFIKNYLG